MWSSGSAGLASCSIAVANSCKDSQTPWVIAFSWLRYAAARCLSPKRSSRASKVSSQVAPFRTPCSKSSGPALQGGDQVCGFLQASPAVMFCYSLELDRNTAHDVVPTNFGGFPALAPVPVPLPRSARASTSAILEPSSRRILSIGGSSFVSRPRS
jgi:hypothetical protein